LPGLLQREARYVRPSMMSYDRAPKTRSQSVQHERPVCPTTYEVSTVACLRILLFWVELDECSFIESGIFQQ